MDSFLRQLPQLLLPWYTENRRLLPWREDRQPYHVWLSEIMLQQTRVEAVRGYYTRFLTQLPDIASVAQAPEELLFKLWEGLGYYSRVRNLKKAATVIMQQYGGRFPESYEQVRALPGIGDYTAGAICSICFNAPTPAVDGNVLRVLARLTADDTPIDTPACKRGAARRLAQIYPPEAGDFTQSMMELGATVCLPGGAPDCVRCPCAGICQALAHGRTRQLPVRLPKRPRREEEKTVFLFHCDGRYALLRRQEQGLLAGLWQFPEAPGKLEPEQAVAQAQDMGLQVQQLLRQTDADHVFTHITWHMRCYYLETVQTCDSFTWLTAQQIDAEHALPTAFRQFWDKREPKHW